jgi:hypothetical protein
MDSPDHEPKVRHAHRSSTKTCSPAIQWFRYNRIVTALGFMELFIDNIENR